MRPPLLALLLLVGCSEETIAPEDHEDAGSQADSATVIIDSGAPDAGVSDAGEFDAGEIDAGAFDAGEADAGALDAGPRAPIEIFGSRYWNVYRPSFLANFYEDGRVCDRQEAGHKAFGDTNVFMSYGLSTFVFEYRAAKLDASLQRISEILDAIAAMDTVYGDPLDGYAYRSDRGNDFESNWLIAPPAAPAIKQNLRTRDNEPSGDQYFAVLRSLRDVTDTPGPLVWNGADLKAKARDIARLRGLWLKAKAYRMRNPFGDLVKRGDDQRWASWAFAQGAANVTGQPRSDFDAAWEVVPGVLVQPPDQRQITHWWINGDFQFIGSCSAGKSLRIGALDVVVPCNEFNVGLGGDSAAMSLATDPASPDWWGNVVPRSVLVSEGSGVYAAYARYIFHDTDASLLPAIARFLAAPATPPTGDNLDPNGWCTSWRWQRDFDNPRRCIDEPHLFSTFSGVDYMIVRAMASAAGEFPE